jgi:hypothetical protein
MVFESSMVRVLKLAFARDVNSLPIRSSEPAEANMARIVRWLGVAAMLWVIVLVTITTIRIKFLVMPPNGYDAQTQLLSDAQTEVLNVGQSAIGLLAPVVQFGLIIAILIYAAKQIGLLSSGGVNPWKADTFNVQSVIAIVVIGTFSLSALTGLGSSHVSDLKDIVLVVVGSILGRSDGKWMRPPMRQLRVPWLEWPPQAPLLAVERCRHPRKMMGAAPCRILDL